MVRTTPLLIALLVIGTVGTVGVVADETFVSMTAEPVPNQPTADAEFAVDVHFESAVDGGDVYDIESVRVYDVTGDAEERLETQNTAPPIAPGDSRTVRVDELELDEPGVYDLRVEATLSSNGTERVVETTIQVEVSGTEPALGVDVEPGVAGAWRSLNLTLANRDNASVRGITLGVNGTDVQFRPDERVVSSLAAGEERTLAFEAKSPRLGRHDIAVSLTYRESDGDVRSVERTLTANFARPDTPSEARLTEVNVTATQTGLRVEGSVVNDGTSGIEGVSVAVANRDGVTATAPSPESFVGSLAADARGSFTVTAALDEERSTIPLAVTYRVDGVEYETLRKVAYEGPRTVESLQVTDISVTPSAAGVRINGSAANVGTAGASSVTVEVLNADGVSPVAPRSASFLGSVGTGESADFELTAALAADRETIPLAVRYTVDGVTYTATSTITYDGASGVEPLELTGVSAKPTAGGVELEGSAANRGSELVESVVVAVGEADGVRPSAPQPEYFVGTVESSDFASFTVTASVDGNRSTVPLTVTYKVDGVTYESQTTVEVQAQRNVPDEPANGGGGFPIVFVIGGLVVIGLMAVVYRRRR